MFPHLDRVTDRSEPGHPLFADRSMQGFGRFDNLDLYAATSAAGAIGEMFQSIRTWTADMLPHPDAARLGAAVGDVLFDADRHQLLNLDDAQTLVECRLRPTDAITRDRHVTQRLAAQVWKQHRFAGISFWSNVRPQWQVHVIWDLDALQLAAVDRLVTSRSARC